MDALATILGGGPTPVDVYFSVSAATAGLAPDSIYCTGFPPAAPAAFLRIAPGTLGLATGTTPDDIDGSIVSRPAGTAACAPLSFATGDRIFISLTPTSPLVVAGLSPATLYSLTTSGGAALTGMAMAPTLTPAQLTLRTADDLNAIVAYEPGENHCKDDEQCFVDNLCACGQCIAGICEVQVFPGCDESPCPVVDHPVPAQSGLAVVVMLLMVLASGTIVLGHHRTAAA